jgi:HNH endonuclease
VPIPTKPIPLHVLAVIRDRDLCWSRVDASGGRDACHDWTGSRVNAPPNDYGRLYVWVAGVDHQYRAHRVAYILIHGEPPPERPYILHGCHRPPCCNPNHLLLGTHQENMDDMVAAGRQSRLFGETNPSAVLTEATVLEVLRLYGEGFTQEQIAGIVGASLDAIQRVLTRRAWTHITADLPIPIRPARDRPPLPDEVAEEILTLAAQGHDLRGIWRRTTRSVPKAAIRQVLADREAVPA